MVNHAKAVQLQHELGDREDVLQEANRFECPQSNNSLWKISVTFLKLTASLLPDLITIIITATFSSSHQPSGWGRLFAFRQAGRCRGRFPLTPIL